MGRIGSSGLTGDDMSIRLKAVFILSVFFIVDLQPVPAVNIRINDTRESNYYLEALYWILEKSGKDYAVVHTDYPLSSQARKIAFVKNGNIDIIYAGTSMDLEKKLLPVRFPILRGLAGQRVFIIHRDYQGAYRRVSGLNDLRRYVGFQGLGWSDRKVLEASGLRQMAELYDDIFTDINAGAAHYFPRGVTEAFSELSDRQDEMVNLTVEKHLLLVYKTAVFFFVNPLNRELADILETGFLKGYEDGSYPRFFYDHPLITTSLKKAGAKDRIRIEIPNPFLSPETEAIPDRYWHRD